MKKTLHRHAVGFALLLLGMVALGTQAWAQLAVPPAASQFDITGFLEEATLGGTAPDGTILTDPNPKLSGGMLKVNGHVVTVPKNTVVIFPASALTWQEVFTQAPAPYTGVATGMAMADVPKPLTTYEVHVIGNKVGNNYIAGLIDISQQGLNSGAGYVNYIDYAAGEIRVGGTIVKNAAGVPINSLDATNPGARVRINDPTGKFSKGLSPDTRFTLDPDNPTIRTETAFPVCLPRTDPTVVDDPLCPQGNRPKDQAGNFISAITMNDPVTFPGILPDANKQAPIEVADFVTFAGTLVTDVAPGPTAGPTTAPYPAAGVSATYISAHTLIDNTAIYTWPGTNPVYVAVDVTILGVGGTTVVGAGEAAVRTRFEGFTTDASRNVHLYGMDADPLTGAITDRDWGTIGIDPGPATGAVKGRWRFRPPCTVAVATQKECVPPAAGIFLPATRMVRAVVEGAWVPGQTSTAANGLIWGQYQAPILEYIFPENIPGTPPPPNNFETIPFLAQGGNSSALGTVTGQLKPWPGDVAPTPAIVPPTASATASSLTVASGGTVTLSASATGTGPFTYAWAQTAGPAVTPSPLPNTANVAIAVPIVAVNTPVTFQVTVTGAAAPASTASVTVTINAAAAPTALAGATQVVNSGSVVTLHGSGTDPNGLALTYHWVQGGPTAAAFPVTLNPSANVAQPTFSLVLPVAQPQVVLWFQLVVTNSAGVSSVADVTTVTVNPIPDSVVITSAEYRTGKQRLIITATSSVVSPSVVLSLQPYVTTTGSTFTPIPAELVNGGGGLYTATYVGVPQPANPPATPLVVKSNLGGASVPTALTRIRQ